MTLRFSGARWTAAVLLFLLTFSWSARARADHAVALVLHGDPLPEERVREAVARELGREVTLTSSGDDGVLTITWRKAAGELAVTWDGPKRGTVSRVIAARPRIDDVISDAAILAGNLARDEASELGGPPVVPVVPPLPTPVYPTDEPRPQPEVRPRLVLPREPEPFAEANASLLYPIATNIGRPTLRTYFDINLLHSRLGQLDGLGIGGLNVVARSDGHGTGDVTGVELAYAANIAGGRLTGLQAAFVGNYADEGVGWQFAFGANYTHRGFRGIQTSLVLNVAGSSEGAGSSGGGQLGGINVSHDFHGAQVGALNVSRDLEGAQVGFVNVARKSTGFVLGLVNVAEDYDGLPIGIVSVSKTGGVHPEAWTSLTTFGNVGLKLATRHTYTMPSMHWHRIYDRDFFGPGFTVGGRIVVDEARHVDLDLGVDYLWATERSHLAEVPADTYHEQLVQTKLRGLFGWTFARHFGVYAGVGATVQVRLEREGERATIRLGPDFFVGVEL